MVIDYKDVLHKLIIKEQTEEYLDDREYFMLDKLIEWQVQEDLK